ncbi:DNA polymerase zeta processivity subunit-like [Cucurbita maxima]|uniref:DNA polymerase zeta processivity subunit-like n=1 Tax=Cucurbita maxima TaxID=3661 RepID=A0A6J1JAH6_CUCMA|nr:DNA polymerase zeta processivity subunit-like [Cucurbita maxima]
MEKIGIVSNYWWGLYEDAFEKRWLMNAVVQKAHHPELQDYIHSTVSGLLSFIQKVDHSLLFLSSIYVKIKFGSSLPSRRFKNETLFTSSGLWRLLWRVQNEYQALASTRSKHPIKSMNSQPLSLQLYLQHPSLSEPKPCE